MNKILINIYIPYLDKNYDIFLPINVETKYAMDLIQDQLKEISNGYYCKKENIILIDSLTTKVINLNNIVKFSGLRNGSRVILL
jgi:archaellum biogenesis ATPase FlaH